VIYIFHFIVKSPYFLRLKPDVDKLKISLPSFGASKHSLVIGEYPFACLFSLFNPGM